MSDVGGSLLRRAGLVNARDLDEARALQAAEGGLLVEWLIAIGAVAEDEVAEFFHRHLLVPRVDKRLARLPKAVLATVPPDMAAEFAVCPVELDDDGSLLLAMADPADASVVDEVSFFTERFCQRAVAAPSLVRQAIERHYGIKRPHLQPPAPPIELLDLAPLASPQDIERDLEALPPAAVAPPPERLRRITLSDAPIVAPPDPPLVALREAASRDEIAHLLVDWLAAIMPRVALMVMRRGRLAGLAGRALDEQAVQTLDLPLDEPSLFRDVVQSRLPYRGALADTPLHQRLAATLGTVVGDVFLCPIAVRDRVVAVLYGDGINGPLPDATLLAVTRAAGSAYERTILAQKGLEPKGKASAGDAT